MFAVGKAIDQQGVAYGMLRTPVPAVEPILVCGDIRSADGQGDAALVRGGGGESGDGRARRQGGKAAGSGAFVLQHDRMSHTGHGFGRGGIHASTGKKTRHEEKNRNLDMWRLHTNTFVQVVKTALATIFVQQEQYLAAHPEVFSNTLLLKPSWRSDIASRGFAPCRGVFFFSYSTEWIFATIKCGSVSGAVDSILRSSRTNAFRSVTFCDMHYLATFPAGFRAAAGAHAAAPRPGVALPPPTGRVLRTRTE
ncbi:MAG: hypothetical protein AAGU21_11650 [Solidesulfovibrio sp.]|uniref:hypothetical protein n=1 Tax=Solidesulfovibrio sp. TaxID=2910990 RepID=UPI002B21AFEC|nr:hypothetical protein [Solidesulfovibrio sp.]MEA4856819.1 hypothetical protein [Solidesulfovibrio sp.]